MTDQKSPKDQAVHVPRYAFEVMAARTAVDEDKVAVMLLLLMRMDGNRAVRVGTSLLSDFLTLNIERVEYVISSLIKNGWVESVDDRAMRSRVLDCVVHPAFIHADFDTLMRVVSSRIL
ncbi:hypothetical protein [Pseudomonas sp. P8_241]|uniref:hypothetical protein n=1 Tax=Pseudomonas sp. P8_241 TaxID=3043445 RepID=UPI002A35C438|nr:hypothetical protein [Pseudomonas sp. P8_241]WPN49118.1 hypothetical protein QMK58_10805 [Pseudomonas sp. P8_241]